MFKVCFFRRERCFDYVEELFRKDIVLNEIVKENFLLVLVIFIIKGEIVYYF